MDGTKMAAGTCSRADRGRSEHIVRQDEMSMKPEGRNANGHAEKPRVEGLWGELMIYKLGEICEIVSGSTPKTSIPEYWDGDIKWITPAELNDDSYIMNDSIRKITELGVKKTGLSPFPAGTVILSSRAPIG